MSSPMDVSMVNGEGCGGGAGGGVTAIELQQDAVSLPSPVAVPAPDDKVLVSGTRDDADTFLCFDQFLVLL